MSYRLLRTRTVKVRKPRDCHWCGEPYSIHGELLVERHRIDGELTLAPAPENRAPIRRPIQGSLFGGFA